jgi:hypothetical protein
VLPQRPRLDLPGDDADKSQDVGVVSLIHEHRDALARDRDRIRTIIRTSLWAAPSTLAATIAAYQLLHLAGVNHPKVDGGLFMLAIIAMSATVGAVMAWRETRQTGRTS